jgi:putative phosphoesterase
VQRKSISGGKHMIIAVISDSHDNIWNLRRAVGVIRSEKAEMIIHCGDFVAPFMLKELEAAEIPVHGVFGNNDGDQFLLSKMAFTELKNITLHGLIGQVDSGGFKVSFTHYGEVARGLAAAGDSNLVCYGHSHTFSEKKMEKSILLNPGEIMGKEGSPGFCLVDTVTSEVKRIELSGLGG